MYQQTKDIEGKINEPVISETKVDQLSLREVIKADIEVIVVVK